MYYLNEPLGRLIMNAQLKYFKMEFYISFYNNTWVLTYSECQIDSALHSFIAAAMNGTRTFDQMVTANSEMVQYIFDIDKWATQRRYILYEHGLNNLYPKISVLTVR